MATSLYRMPCFWPPEWRILSRKLSSSFGQHQQPIWTSMLWVSSGRYAWWLLCLFEFIDTPRLNVCPIPPSQDFPHVSPTNTSAHIKATILLSRRQVSNIVLSSLLIEIRFKLMSWVVMVLFSGWVPAQNYFSSLADVHVALTRTSAKANLLSEPVSYLIFWALALLAAFETTQFVLKCFQNIFSLPGRLHFAALTRRRVTRQFKPSAEIIGRAQGWTKDLQINVISLAYSN